MKGSQRIIAVVFCIVIFYAPSNAWNSFGHMSVAYVAYQKLTPTTKQRVAALLKLNPRYNEWVSKIPPNISAADKEMMIFMLAATWPDEIKTDQTYKNDGPQGGNRPPQGPTASQNIGYTDHLRHKYWHFVDTALTQDNTPLAPLPIPNAQTEITMLRQAISSQERDEIKSYDLVWLLHLVGDVHQPLHCATRFTTQEKTGDSGGNTVKICQGHNCRGELHAFWDDLLGTSNDPSQVVTVARALPAADADRAADSDEKHWVKESFDLAQSAAYVNPIGDGDGPFTITSSYQSNAHKIAEQRVALAGARLAGLLNHDLK